MKPGKHILFIMIFSILFLFACGGGGGGGGSSDASNEEIAAPVAVAPNDLSVGIDETVILDGSGSTDAKNSINAYHWEQISGPTIQLVNADTNVAHFQADLNKNAIIEIKLTVTNSAGLSSSDTCTVTVFMADVNTKEQAQTLLYMAYAGAGYGDATIPENPIDDEVMYAVASRDLNYLANNLTNEMIADQTFITKLLTVGASPISNTSNCEFTLANGSRVEATISKKVVLFKDFQEVNVTARIWLSRDGLALGNVSYSGASGTDPDLEISTKGFIQIINISKMEFEFIARAITITAKKGLVATYKGYSFSNVLYDDLQSSYLIYYGNNEPETAENDNTSKGFWNIDLIEVSGFNVFIPNRFFDGYTVNNNLKDYTINGGFAIDGNSYKYNTVKYNHVLSSQAVSVSGSIVIPEIGAPLKISSSDVKENAGIWNAGKITIKGASNTVTAQLAADKSVSFSGSLGSWTVANWQDELNPLK